MPMKLHKPLPIQFFQLNSDAMKLHLTQNIMLDCNLGFSRLCFLQTCHDLTYIYIYIYIYISCHSLFFM
jgi:hypothetical protein